MRQLFPNMKLEALDASHWREPFIAFYSILFLLIYRTVFPWPDHGFMSFSTCWKVSFSVTYIPEPCLTRLKDPRTSWKSFVGSLHRWRSVECAVIERTLHRGIERSIVDAIHTLREIRMPGYRRVTYVPKSPCFRALWSWPYIVLIKIWHSVQYIVPWMEPYIWLSNKSDTSEGTNLSLPAHFLAWTLQLTERACSISGCAFYRYIYVLDRQMKLRLYFSASHCAFTCCEKALVTFRVVFSN